MAAVAAASAELLIIGWYIFRVLLQAKTSVTGIPSLLLPPRATPHTPEEREPVSRVDEKLVEEGPET
ncbi:hypothetical protein STEG23_023152 [Scotinomys teguina]